MGWLKRGWSTDAAPAATTFNFRPLNVNDFDAVRALSNSSFPIRYPDVWLGSLCVNKNNDYRTVGCFTTNGTLVGFVVVVPDHYNYEVVHHPTEFEMTLANEVDNKVAYVSSIAVDRNFQRMGIGSELLRLAMAICLSDAKEPRLMYLHVHHANVAAQRMYERMGFVNRHTNTRYYYIDHQEQAAYIFVKYLTMWRTDKMPFWMRCDIRHLKENDLDAVKKLSNEELPVQYSDAWFHRICENDADEYLAIGCFNQHLYGFIAIDREYYKNELKRKPNRCSAFEKELSVEAKEQMSYVVSVAVCKEFQNMGIATELMRMAIELLKEETKPNVIYLHVLVDNEPALKLYSKFGFVNRHTNDQYLIVRPEEFRAAHIFVKKLDV